MISVLAACLVLASPASTPEARVDKIVDAAWAASGQATSAQAPSGQTPSGQAPQDQTDPAALAEKKHQSELADDRAVGKKYAAEVDKELKPSDDKVNTDRVKRIGKVLGDIANQVRTIATYGDGRMNTFDYDFKLVKGKEPNAFSLPGGHIYVYDGLIGYLESDDELAGILAHEISHAKFRHLATLQHQDANLNKITIPLAILSILTGGLAAVPAALMANNLVHQAEGSGWSVQAESAADYGGLQLVEKSPWNPTGLLTTMERFAEDERFNPALKDLGIFRDHPPSRERADALIEHMKEASVPIQRSKVTTSFRATSTLEHDGSYDVKFGKTHLVTFAGVDAQSRSQTAVDRLNDFFDSTPDLFQVSISSDGWVYGLGRPLIKVTADDAFLARLSLLSLQGDAVANIKKSLYTLSYKTWEGE
jgi:predicted Zn-dependent protease